MLKNIKKLVSKKRKYVKNNFGIESVISKEIPVYNSAFNSDEFSKMREGYYTSMPKNLSRELKSKVRRFYCF